MGRSLRGQFSGVVRYTYDLVRALAPRLDDRLTIFLTRASDGLDDVRVRRIRAPFPTPNEYAGAARRGRPLPSTTRYRSALRAVRGNHGAPQEPGSADPRLWQRRRVDRFATRPGDRRGHGLEERRRAGRLARFASG